MDVITMGIAPPPTGSLADLVVYAVAGGCFVGGLALVFAGRTLDRAILCVVGVAIGMSVGGPVADVAGWHPTPVRLVLGAVLGVAGLALARIVWAVLAGAGVALAAELAMLPQLAPEQMPPPAETPETMAAWAAQVCNFLYDAARALSEQLGPLTWIVVVAAAAAAVAVVLVFARIGRIVMSSALGALGVVVGPMVALGRLRPSVTDGAWTNATWWLIPVGAIALGGIAFQCRSAVKEQRAREEAEDEDDEEDQDEPREKKRPRARSGRKSNRKAKAGS
jgi:hypothetical protein